VENKAKNGTFKEPVRGMSVSKVCCECESEEIVPVVYSFLGYLKTVSVPDYI
jgi:hypothetical protein